MVSLIFTLSLLGATAAPGSGPSVAAAPPAVGERAPDFTLLALNGSPVTLSVERRAGPIVLVVGRGWVGYQCPFCNRQIGDFLRNADAIAGASARVVWVYPGPTPEIQKRAEEFAQDRSLPPHFKFVLDPNYTFTVAYGLRWNAPQETAYPSTFVIDRDGIVRYAFVSRTHGGRATAAQVLAALQALKP